MLCFSQRLATRALALPLFDGNSSNTIDCSDYNSSQCVMRVTAPATMNWQYIAFKSTMQDEEVEFELSVTLHSKLSFNELLLVFMASVHLIVQLS